MLHSQGYIDGQRLAKHNLGNKIGVYNKWYQKSSTLCGLEISQNQNLSKIASPAGESFVQTMKLWNGVTNA